MNAPDRQFAQEFAQLADTLVEDFDLIDFLHLLTVRCVRLLGVDAAGLLLADVSGTLTVVAASSERVRLLELFQLQNLEGPCIEAYRTGVQVQCPNLADAVERWPRFAAAAQDAGFTAVHALPMRLRDQIIGALNLFGTRVGTLDEGDLKVGQALADVATIGLLHERSYRHQEVLVEQLNHALNSRVAIEQAKGVLAQRMNLGMADSFEMLRGYARRRQLRLVDLALAVVNADPRIDDLYQTTPPAAARTNTPDADHAGD
jgi:ANTAR domain-containing protein/GAF domain-containing protein